VQAGLLVPLLERTGMDIALQVGSLAVAGSGLALEGFASAVPGSCFHEQLPGQQSKVLSCST